MTPDLRPVQTVVQALKAAQIVCALGGSGLLYRLGLTDQVRDWDLTTEAPLSAVDAALTAYDRRLLPPNPAYASRFLLQVSLDGQVVEVIGRFAIQTAEGPCHIPTIPANAWEGVPVSAPEVWAAAYRLMGREEKADLLAAYVTRTGARPETIALLLAQPLPARVREEVAGWQQGCTK